MMAVLFSSNRHCIWSTKRFGLLYPISFNYRHGLEVAIKWTLDRYGRYSAMRLTTRTITSIPGKGAVGALRVENMSRNNFRCRHRGDIAKTFH